MNEKEYSNEELEEEIDKALEISEKKLNIFRIIKNEKDALGRKDKRMKAKIKPTKRTDELD
ncbi:MAG: hypothetical protein HWN80_02880 [Candidatus Lokiarchaeota archaeon]|nr:hypothetical protein [Candidatus Lokiarchaeota archaeon]